MIEHVSFSPSAIDEFFRQLHSGDVFNTLLSIYGSESRLENNLANRELYYNEIANALDHFRTGVPGQPDCFGLLCGTFVNRIRAKSQRQRYVQVRMKTRFCTLCWDSLL